MNIKVDINVCRICLKSENGRSIISDSTIMDKFQFSTLIKIQDNDGMPTIICERCEARLNISYEFKKQAIISDTHLKEFINRVNNQFKEVANTTFSATMTQLKSESNNEEMNLLMEAGYKPIPAAVATTATTKPTTTATVIQVESITQEENDPSIHHHHFQRQHHQHHSHHQIETIGSTEAHVVVSHHQNHNATIEEDFHGLIQEDDGSGQEYADETIVDDSGLHNQNDDDGDDDNDDEDEEGNEHITEHHINNNDCVTVMTENCEQLEDIEENNIIMHNQITPLPSSSTVSTAVAVAIAKVKPTTTIVTNTNSSSSKNINDNHGNENQELIPVEFIVTEYTREQQAIDPLKTNNEKSGHENRSNICIKCDRDFSTKTNLIRHMMTHDGVKPFQCNICGNGFTQNGSLKQHMLIHTGERPYKCNVCGRGFTQGKSLVFHMRRHTGEKPYTCDKCGLTFRQKDGLKRHVLMKHTETAAEVHICSICSRILQSKYSLQIHMKKHLLQPDSLYRCEICEKNFSSKGSLEIHQRQHTGEKPYKCEQCGKEFPRKSSLMTHSKVHLEEKPFKCDQCDKGFIQKQLLVSHVQNVHNIKPVKAFQCGKCLKSFAIKRNLLQHLRNHNRDSMTMYKCEECSIAFNTKRGLKLHRFNDHKEAVTDLNECDICNIPFVSVNDLNQHMNSVHDSINEKCSICMEHFTSRKLLDDHLLEHELMTVDQSS